MRGSVLASLVRLIRSAESGSGLAPVPAGIGFSFGGRGLMMLGMLPTPSGVMACRVVGPSAFLYVRLDYVSCFVAALPVLLLAIVVPPLGTAVLAV